MEDGHIKKNILFLVEGQTEGNQSLWGKGLYNILREEHQWMRGNRISHTVHVFNGKWDMMENLEFRIKQHINPPKKVKAKKLAKGKEIGDYVVILRDLDCEDKDSLRSEIDEKLSAYSGQYSLHFAAQEIESWMVADPDGFRRVYKFNSECIYDRVFPLSSNPEEKNCNPKISKRLSRAVKSCDENYRKTMEGPQLLKEVDPLLVARKCPHFKSFRDDVRILIEMPPVEE